MKLLICFSIAFFSATMAQETNRSAGFECYVDGFNGLDYRGYQIQMADNGQQCESWAAMTSVGRKWKAWDIIKVIGKLKETDGFTNFSSCRNLGKWTRDEFGCYTSGNRFQTCYNTVSTCNTMCRGNNTFNPCLNGGNCEPTETAYRCNCAPGFTGTNCEVDIDDCLSSPCENDGVCTDNGQGFLCNCTEDYGGLRCENERCSRNPCARGTCSDTSLGFRCNCPDGYSGRRCEELNNKCANNPCKNKAGCVNELMDQYTCLCTPGYTGEHCEIDQCEGSCLNGATCERTEESRGYRCICAPGFTGTNCGRMLSTTNKCHSFTCKGAGCVTTSAPTNNNFCTLPPGGQCYANRITENDVVVSETVGCVAGSGCVVGIETIGSGFDARTTLYCCNGNLCNSNTGTVPINAGGLQGDSAVDMARAQPVFVSAVLFALNIVL